MDKMPEKDPKEREGFSGPISQNSSLIDNEFTKELTY